ncbi:hypothetical protein PoB_004891300 [Plakobranchus ocellatus]|uniref:Uncharacterized protein n=1 Tax=Plakobranchus ocellatus TaxID=259542 RepID=A0AAV4BUD2_9GAST|nr:hypothetical protein PoB_004891300 [Plakobranchus ocellatus]
MFTAWLFRLFRLVKHRHAWVQEVRIQGIRNPSPAKVMYLRMLIMYYFSARRGHIFTLKLEKFVSFSGGFAFLILPMTMLPPCTPFWENPQSFPLPAIPLHGTPSSKVLDPAPDW